jgi:GT2 family glycosyltransferase
MNLHFLAVRQLVSAARVFPPLRPVLRTGGRVLRRFGWRPPAPEGAPRQTDYARWVEQHDTLDEADRAAIRAHVARLRSPPLISVVMPAYETPAPLLRAAIASVRAQLYPHWELCIADDASPSARVAAVLAEAAAADPRIRWVRRETNGHIAAASNTALSLARGEFVALMDHDDLLPEHALYEVAAELEAHPDADILYSDEDKIDERGQRFDPHFKPAWSLDLMLGHNVVSHLGVYRRSLLERIGGFREGFEGSQDYDLALRAAGATSAGRIRHIPAILYHWRQAAVGGSFSQEQLDRCVDAARRAIADHLRVRGVAGAEVLPAPLAMNWTRVRWPLPDPAPRVSIVVPTRDGARLLAQCLNGVLRRTDYPDIEVLVIDNDSREPETLALFAELGADPRVRVLPMPGPFNYSALNNAAVEAASGSIILLLNNDVDVIGRDWLREMVALAVRPEVGAVGAKLLYGDGRVQHAGVVLGFGHHAGGPGVAGHYGVFAGRDDPGYSGQYALARELGAVTGACLALRREVFLAVGGLDPVNLPVSFNDVDLCLRIRAMGLAIVWTPFAELYHLESATRGSDLRPDQIARATAEAEHMRQRWGPVLDADPFYNPVFDRADRTFRFSDQPRRRKPWLRDPAGGPG